MSREYQSEMNIAQITDAAVYAAIKYLDPDLDHTRAEQDDGAAVVICVSVIFVILGWVAFSWLYQRM